jgi:hypothetical protein
VITEKDMPTIELELYFADGRLRPASVTVRHDADESEVRTSDLRFPLSTYLRLATLTVAYEPQEELNPGVVVYLPVAPYGGIAVFALRGDEIAPLHAGDWDDEVTAKADHAMRKPHRRARRPYGRLDQAQQAAFLSRVASVYREAAVAGEAPIKKIMRQEYVSRPTASRWIALARERGLLPAADGPHSWRDLKDR